MAHLVPTEAFLQPSPEAAMLCTHFYNLVTLNQDLSCQYRLRNPRSFYSSAFGNSFGKKSESLRTPLGVLNSNHFGHLVGWFIKAISFEQRHKTNRILPESLTIEYFINTNTFIIACECFQGNHGAFQWRETLDLWGGMGDPSFLSISQIVYIHAYIIKLM